MSAFEMISKWPPGCEVWLTADGYAPLRGKISDTKQVNKVVVFVAWDQWLEFTDQSDIEVKAPGQIHVNG